MDQAIRHLLDAMEAAESAGAPLTDTVIREAIYDVIHEGFILMRPGYSVPNNLLLDYTEGARQQNETVVKALARFLDEAKREAAANGLDTPESRERAFLDSEAESSSGEVGVLSFFD
jgi:hypothetical protein